MKKTLIQCPQVSAVVKLGTFLSKSFLGLAGTEIFQLYFIKVQRKCSGFLLSAISQWNSSFLSQNVEGFLIVMLNITLKGWIRSLWWEQTVWQALGIAVWLYLTLLCDRHAALQFHERGTLNCTTCNFVKDEILQEQKLKFKVLLSLHLWSKNNGAVATRRILCYSLFELM